MVLLIAGGTHTGKTLLAQKLVARHHWSALSIDHLKMGLVRAGLCPLTPQSSGAELTEFLWPVVREMVKTAVENSQDLIVEGCYIPFPGGRILTGATCPTSVLCAWCSATPICRAILRTCWPTPTTPNSAWTTACAPGRPCWRKTGPIWKPAAAGAAIIC